MKNIQLSKNLWLSETIKSKTAMRRGISNYPTDDHLDNLKYIAKNLFQPIRDAAGAPIHVSSGYRSKELNKAIGGSKTSHHMLGLALDIDNDYRNNTWTNSQIFYFIKDNLEFDVLIWEFGDESPNWVHCSYVKGLNRGQVYRNSRENGLELYYEKTNLKKDWVITEKPSKKEQKKKLINILRLIR